MGTRIYFLDNLRSALIILAIIASAATGFMLLPPDQAYVIQGTLPQGQRSAGFDIFYLWADAFIIPALFFISGYFGASSLRIRQFKPFFKQKWHRLGWIWLFGTLILAPQLAYLAAGPLDDTENIVSFYLVHFWTDCFQQGQFWFLGILLGLYTVLMAAKKIRPHCLQRKPAATASRLLLLLIVIIDGAAMTAAYLFYGSRWVHPLYLFMFQPIHLADIFLYFLLGVYAFKRRWFTAGGYVPSWRWILPFALFSILYIGYKIPSLLFMATPYYIWFLPAIRALVTMTALLALLGVFHAWGQSQRPFALTLTAVSYPLFILSQTLLQNTAWFLRLLAVDSLLKFTLLCGLTLIYAYMLSKYILLRFPLFKK